MNALRNSELIDPARRIFRVLGMVEVMLRGVPLWQGEDFNSDQARGASFHGFFEAGGRDCANLLVADVTGDIEEPRIDELTPAIVKTFDDGLRSGIAHALEEQGMSLLEWMGSHENRTHGRPALLTAYKKLDPYAGERQVATLRFTHGERKIAIEVAFNVADADRLAGPMFSSLHPIELL